MIFVQLCGIPRDPAFFCLCSWRMPKFKHIQYSASLFSPLGVTSVMHALSSHFLNNCWDYFLILGVLCNLNLSDSLWCAGGPKSCIYYAKLSVMDTLIDGQERLNISPVPFPSFPRPQLLLLVVLLSWLFWPFWHSSLQLTLVSFTPEPMSVIFVDLQDVCHLQSVISASITYGLLFQIVVFVSSPSPLASGGLGKLSVKNTFFPLICIETDNV